MKKISANEIRVRFPESKFHIIPTEEGKYFVYGVYQGEWLLPGVDIDSPKDFTDDKPIFNNYWTK